MNGYLGSIKKQFFYYKGLADKSMAQLSDDELFWQYNEESNSIAVIVKHLAGNMLSRFTDFLTSDGEKPWRNRDSEFVNDFQNAGEVRSLWERGWKVLENTLDGLEDNDLGRIVYIRNEGHTVLEALNRQLAHYPYHIGQITYIAKMIRNTDWKTLSIARNRSDEYNSDKFSKEKGIRHFTDNA